MQAILLTLCCCSWMADIGPGNHDRSITVEGLTRSYRLHIPPTYDPKKPTPVVLVFHGSAMNGSMMAWYCGLNKKANAAGFVAIYPNGTGIADQFLLWNTGGLIRGSDNSPRPDDVLFVSRLLDDVATVVNVDAKRVFATGLSAGGMLCYKLAAELSDRVAAIAPVGGTMPAVGEYRPKRPVSVIHFHGTADGLVPYDGPAAFLNFKSVKETIDTCVKVNKCPETPTSVSLPNQADDGTKVTQATYGLGQDGAEVVLYTIENGGHTWPGRQSLTSILGKSTKNISVNDVIWAFFQKHPMISR